MNISENAKVVIDSGTSLITLPSPILNQFYSLLKQNADCGFEKGTILCNCDGEFPDLFFVLDGIETVIPSSIYMTQVPSYCQILVQALDYGGYFILGDVFMRQYYTLFSADNQTIGFALARPFEPSHFSRTFFIVVSIFISFLIVLTTLRRHCLSYRERKLFLESMNSEPLNAGTMYLDLATRPNQVGQI